MVPPHVSIHAARVTAGAPWARWNTDATAVELAADVQHGAEQFANMQLCAVVIGHSSSSFLGGVGWDEAVVTRLAQTLSSSIMLSTNGLDCLAAMRASGISHPLLVMPAWFGPKIVTAGVCYFTEHGITPGATLSYDAGSRWHGVAHESMYPQGMGFDQEIEPLFQQITNTCTTSIDGVLIAGTGFRSVAIIEKLENTLNLPVITANQASLWNCLRRTGNKTKINGYGQLLSAQ